VTSLDDGDSSCPVSPAARPAVRTFSRRDCRGRRDSVFRAGGGHTQLYCTPPAPPIRRSDQSLKNRVLCLARGVLLSSSRVTLPSRMENSSANDSRTPGIEVGRPGETVWRVRVESNLESSRSSYPTVTCRIPRTRDDGVRGCELTETLAKAKAWADRACPAYKSGDRTAAMVEFPGGYIARFTKSPIDPSANRRGRNSECPPSDSASKTNRR